MARGGFLNRWQGHNEIGFEESVFALYINEAPRFIPFCLRRFESKGVRTSVIISLTSGIG